MPTMKRFKTDYVGVYYIKGTAIANGKPEKIFYITYRRNGKLVEEKAGRQFSDATTPAKASRIRAERIEGKSLSNKARREEKARQKAIKEWTIKRIWEEYKSTHPLTKGIKSDDGRFKLHIEPTLGDKKFEEVAPLDLDRLRINLLRKKSPQTVKHVIGIIKRISNFAANKRLCRGLDFKPTSPKVNNLKTEFLSEEQVMILLDVIDKDPHPYAGSMMKMALYTGMRRGELFRLHWTDIDFERGFVKIRYPKGGVDQIIPLNDATRTVLKLLPRTGSDFVFPGRAGGQRTDINHQINVIKERAGLPKDFRPLHGLRHHYASMLASSGKVDMYVLQKLLTHKSPIMTQRYAHLRDETLKKASQLAGELVDQIIKKEGKDVVKLETR